MNKLSAKFKLKHTWDFMKKDINEALLLNAAEKHTEHRTRTKRITELLSDEPWGGSSSPVTNYSYSFVSWCQRLLENNLTASAVTFSSRRTSLYIQTDSDWLSALMTSLWQWTQQQRYRCFLEVTNGIKSVFLLFFWSNLHVLLHEAGLEKFCSRRSGRWLFLQHPVHTANRW